MYLFSNRKYVETHCTCLTPPILSARTDLVYFAVTYIGRYLFTLKTQYLSPYRDRSQITFAFFLNFDSPTPTSFALLLHKTVKFTIDKHPPPFYKPNLWKPPKRTDESTCHILIDRLKNESRIYFAKKAEHHTCISGFCQQSSIFSVQTWMPHWILIVHWTVNFIP